MRSVPSVSDLYGHDAVKRLLADRISTLLTATYESPRDAPARPFLSAVELAYMKGRGTGASQRPPASPRVAVQQPLPFPERPHTPTDPATIPQVLATSKGRFVYEPSYPVKVCPLTFPPDFVCIRGCICCAPCRRLGQWGEGEQGPQYVSITGPLECPCLAKPHKSPTSWTR